MNKASILIVEDNFIVMMELKDRLAEMGHEIVGTAASGIEAIKKAGIHRPDLTLMDIRLKGEMDGIEAASVIKKEYDIPVIYLTAHTDDNTLERAKLTEPFGYIIKPFEERELRTTIEMALYKHKIEKRLKESEHWLSATLKSIGDALIATDAYGIVKLINPIAEELTGWKGEDAFGAYIENIFKVKDENNNFLGNPVVISLRYNLLVGETNKILVAQNGKETPVDFSSAPIKGENNSIAGVVLVFRDITERKKAKEILEKQKVFLKQIIDTDPNYIAVKNSKGKFELTNKAMAYAFGTTVDEIIGKNDNEYLTNEDIEYQRKLEYEVLNSEEQIFIPLEKLIDSNGKVHLLQTFRRAINSQEGDEKLVLSVAADITELKLVEKALRESEESLKQKAEELEVLNLKLSESEKELKDLNANKDKFFSIIAHDLRSPFSGLLGLSKILVNDIEKAPKKELRQLANNISKSADLTFKLLENLLQWAKIKTGTISFEPREINLKKILDKVTELYKSNAASKNISLTSSVDDKKIVFADSNMVESIFSNLISNSIKFTAKGGKINIFAESHENFIRINIQDTGIGMSQQKINDLFQIGHNVSSIGTDNEEGSGLGLILCKEFVELNKGELSLQSIVDEGSISSFTLPVRKS